MYSHTQSVGQFQNKIAQQDSIHTLLIRHSHSVLASVGPQVVSGFAITVGALLGVRVGDVGAVGDTDDVGAVGKSDGVNVGVIVGEVGAAEPFVPEVNPREPSAPWVAFANFR